MTIPIQNIYFLLCYAWDTLEEGQVVEVRQDECKSYSDLFARVLESGVTHLLKRGFDRGYLTEEVGTTCPRGKLDVTTTMKRNLLQRHRVHCVVDSLSYDVLHNRIVKTTIGRLVRCNDLDRNLRSRLLGVYRRLHDVAEIELRPKVFGRVVLHRNNAFYGFLLHVCRLLYDNLLIDEKTGTAKFRDFLRDERTMSRVFEKFVFNFFSKEQNLYRVRSERFHWQDVTASDEHLRFLPTMRTDVSLESSDRHIVIDTKYYSQTLQSYFDSDTIHSGNLYQLFAYLKNLQVTEPPSRTLEGVLLYPCVGRTLDLEYAIQGHRMRVATVDLNSHWSEISKRLLGLLEGEKQTRTSFLQLARTMKSED